MIGFHGCCAAPRLERIPADMLAEQLNALLPSIDRRAFFCTSKSCLEVGQQAISERRLKVELIMCRFIKHIDRSWRKLFVKASLGIEGRPARARVSFFVGSGSSSWPWMNGIARIPRDHRAGLGISFGFPVCSVEKEKTQQLWEGCTFYDGIVQSGDVTELRLFIEWQRFAACATIWRAHCKPSPHHRNSWFVTTRSSGPVHYLMRGTARPYRFLEMHSPDGVPAFSQGLIEDT